MAEKLFEMLTVRDSFLSPAFFPFGPEAWGFETQKPGTHACLLCFLQLPLPCGTGWRHSAILYVPI